MKTINSLPRIQRKRIIKRVPDTGTTMRRHNHRIRLASISLTLLGNQRFKILLNTRNTLTQPADTLPDTSLQIRQLTTNPRKLTGGSINPIK